MQKIWLIARRCRRAVLCAVVLAVIARSRAQGPMDAALRGRVTAVGGGGVHAALTLRSSDGLEVKHFQAARDGRFFLLRLPPGEYTLEGAGDGAATSGSIAVVLEPGEIAEVTLVLGGTSSSSPTPPQSSGNTVLAEAVAPADELSLLPVSSRDFQDLSELAPLVNDAAPAASNDSGATNPENDPPQAGEARATSDEGRAASGLSEAGLAVTHSSQSTDGLTAMQYFRSGPRGSAAGGAASETSFAQGAVRRLSAAARSYSADSSGPGGLLTTISTRRGGSALHGSSFVVVRDGAWSATNPFSIVTHYSNGVVSNGLAQPGGATWILGGATGGPLRLSHRRAATQQAAPRVWLFGSAEAQVRHDQLTSTPQLANFYQLTSTQSTLLAVRGVSSTQVRQALNYLDSLTGILYRSALRVNGFGRADINASSHDLVTLSYAAHRLNAPAGAAFGQSSDAVVARGMGSVGDRSVTVDAVAAHWLHRFTGAIDNETSLQATHELNEEQPRPPLAQEPAIGPGGYAPQVSIAPNGFAYGTPPNLGRSAYPEEARIEAQDAFEWRLRSHLLRFGAAWSRIDDRTDSITNAEGTFSYNSNTTGGYDGGLADWITDFTYNVHSYPNGGCPSVYAALHYFCFHTFTQSFGAQTLEFVVHQIAGFAQDSWRVRDDLVLSFGARYEYTLLPLPLAPNFALDAAIATLARANAGATAAIPEDRNNLGPRVSAAWSPGLARSRKAWFTARLGYGVFYGRTPGATVSAALTDTALPGSVERVRIRPTTITQCPQVTGVSQGFGYPCDYTTTPPAAVVQTTSALAFSSHFREPAIQRGSLTLEHAFGSHAWLRAGYAMASATQLATTSDLNIAPSVATKSFVLQGGDGRVGVRNGQVFLLPIYTARPIVQYGTVSLLQSHANASFHAGTLEAGIRAWHGVTTHGSFTFSRAIDYNPQQGATPRLNAQFDPFRIGYDKGLSSLNFPERFSAAFEYRTGRERGHGPQRALTSGWTMGAVAVAGSGAPYSYAIYGGTYLSGGGDSINGSGGAVYLPTVGRNTLRLPTRSRLDLRLTRELPIPHGVHEMHLEVFAQAFNLANSVGISRVETRAFLVGIPAASGAPTPLIFQNAAAIASEGVQTPAFGTPLSSTTGLSRERQMELGLRFQF